jgi:pteridine reductase
MELNGRVALVTGGARRLGRAFAEGLAAEGMRLAVHYAASSEAAMDVVTAIRAAGGEAEAFGADLRDVARAIALPEEVARHFGRLDVVVNSAAVMVHRSVAETTPDEWDDIMRLNLRAPFLVAQHAAPHLARQRGAIINIADLSGLDPWPGYVAHSVSKAGLLMLTRVLAAALAPDVRVNAVAPGAVLVPDDFDAAQREELAADAPLKRLGTPDDALQAVLYLLQHGDFMTGETVVVDGGRRLRR